MVRAEDVVLARRQPTESSARNILEGKVVSVVAEGVLARVTLEVGTTSLVAVVTQGSASELCLVAGEMMTASVKATAVHLC